MSRVTAVLAIASDVGILRGSSSEALESSILRVESLDNPGQPGVVENEPDLAGKVEDLQLSAFFLGGDIGGQDIAHTVAVEKVDFVEIEQDLFFPRGKLLFDLGLDRG